MPRRAWDSLSESYRRRLERSGISADDYAAGSSLKKARGHGTTPERPERAFRHPDRYSEYLRRRVTKGKDVPPDMIPSPKPRMISDAIGWPGRESIDTWVFQRNAGGSVSGQWSTMTHLRVNPDGTVSQVETIRYNQADFATLAKAARDRGFVVQVVSVPSLGVTA